MEAYSPVWSAKAKKATNSFWIIWEYVSSTSYHLVVRYTILVSGSYLDADQPSDAQAVLSGNTQQPSNGEEDVTQDQVDGQLLSSKVSNVKVNTDPAKNTINHGNKGNDTKQSCDDHAGNLETEPSTVGESLQSVGSRRLLLGDDSVASSKRLLSLGVAHLGDGKRGGDTHDARGHQSLTVETETNVGDEHGTGNGGETTGHNLVQLSLGHVGHKGLDQHGRFTLANEGSGRGHNGLGTRHAQAPEEELGELANEPLNESSVEEQLHQSHEEDNRRNDTSEEPRLLGNGRVGQKGYSSVCEAQQRAGEERNELENVESSLGPEHKDGDDELSQHATNDGVPGDCPPVAGRDRQESNHDQKTKDGNGTVGAGVLCLVGGNHGADQEDAQGSESCKGLVQLLRDNVVKADNSVVPDDAEGGHDDRSRCVVEEDAENDGDVEQHGLEPAIVVGAANAIVGNDAVDEPSVTCNEYLLGIKQKRMVLPRCMHLRDEGALHWANPIKYTYTVKKTKTRASITSLMTVRWRR